MRFSYTKFMLIKINNALPKLCMPFHLKMTGTSSTDGAIVKVQLFQKVTFFFLQNENSTEMPSICSFVCMKMFLTAVIKDEHTSNDRLQSDSSFLSRNSMIPGGGGGTISMQFRVFFLRSRYRIGIFFGVAKISNIFWGA